MSSSKRLRVEGIELEIPPKVYEPSEDSFLIFDALDPSPEDRCLDIGTGSGILAIKMGKKAKEVIATDIDPRAVICATKNARRNGVEIHGIICDLAKPIEAKFNLIAFNPPYLPFKDEIPEEKWWYGGKEIIERYCKEELPRILSRDGEAYFVYSSLTGIEDLREIIPREMRGEFIEKESFDFERIYLVRVRWK